MHGVLIYDLRRIPYKIYIISFIFVYKNRRIPAEKRNGTLSHPFMLLLLQSMIWHGMAFCAFVFMGNEVKSKILYSLPPTTRHVSIMSSPSSIGPRMVPFSCLPHRFRTSGCSGGTVNKSIMRFALITT